MKHICLTGESVNSQITDSISENLTDSYLESTENFRINDLKLVLFIHAIYFSFGLTSSDLVWSIDLSMALAGQKYSKLR